MCIIAIFNQFDVNSFRHMRAYALLIALTFNFCFCGKAFSQVTIAYQGFEQNAGDTWSIDSLSTPPCTNGSDIWDYSAGISSILPQTGSQMWGVRDLNGNCGGSGFETMFFDSIDVSSYEDVELKFSYNVFEYDNGDDIEYQVILDGIPQSSIHLVDGSANLSIDWTDEVVSIPNSVNEVSIILQVKQDGGGDYAGFDDFVLEGVLSDPCISAPATQPTTFNPDNISTTDFELNWNPASDSKTLIIASEGAPPNQSPVDGDDYLPDAVFGNGDALGNSFVVYEGTGDQIVISNLTPGTEYFFEAYSFCGASTSTLYNTTSPLSHSVLMEPENPDFLIDCTTSTSMDLSWSPPPAGIWDGYVVIGRENNTPTTINSTNPALVSSNLDFGLAPTIGVNKVLYEGTGTSITLSGLNASQSYTFKVFAYSSCSSCSNPSFWEYSSGTQATAIAELGEVENLATTPALTSIAFTWAIDPACVDEIILVASESPVTGTPSGSNYSVSSSDFTDGLNPSLNPGEKVVYSGTGTSETVIGLTTDTQYCFKAFVRKGTEWSNGIEICETPRESTTLEPGDLSIISVVTNTGGGDDQICFVSYKSITTNTAIDFTDNGYERVSAGLWGDTEGTIRIERTGGTIPAGTPICIEGQGNNQSGFDIYVCGVLDADWSILSLNGSSSFNMNGTDQIWIMQGGLWENPAGLHNAYYTGNVLYGWTAIGWEESPNYASTSGSTLFPNSSCLNTDLETLNNDIVKYNGSFTPASKTDWITRLNDVNNWDSFGSFSDFNNNPPYYATTCVNFDIQAGVFTEGLWVGDTSTEWEDCRNWSNLRLPEPNTNVTIPPSANDPEILQSEATCADLIVDLGAMLSFATPSSTLTISGDVILDGVLAMTDGKIRLDGDGDQTLQSASDPLVIHNLTLDKTAGRVFTDQDIEIADSLVAISGILELADNQKIIFLPGADVSDASNSSFIEGKVRKESTGENFVFPIGDTNADDISFYQPARIFDVTGPAIIDAKYTAEAHPNAGAYYDGNSNDPYDFQEVGNCDYWTVDSIDGSGTVKLGLAYTNLNSAAYCNAVTDPDQLNYSVWNGLNWDIVFSGVSGSYVESVSALSPGILPVAFGDFVFTSNSFLNVLPVELLFFNAKLVGSDVSLTWTTGSETNNSHFDIERAGPDLDFKKIGRVDGVGDSPTQTDYRFIDSKSLLGMSYYRLRQVDFDGSYTYSDIKSIDQNVSRSNFKAYRSGNELVLEYAPNSSANSVQLRSLSGAVIFEAKLDKETWTHRVPLTMSRGVYVVQVIDGSDQLTAKLIW